MHISEPDAKACFEALEGQTSTFVTRDEQGQSAVHNLLATIEVLAIITLTIWIVNKLYGYFTI